MVKSPLPAVRMRMARRAVVPCCLLLALLAGGAVAAAPAGRRPQARPGATTAPRVSIPSRPATPHERFLAVKSWTGNVSWSYSYTATETLGEVTTTKTKRETVSATCFLKRKPPPPEAVAAGYTQSGLWAGRATVNGTYYEEDVLVAGTVTSRTVKRGSGTSVLKDEEIFVIDIEHGTYTLGVPAAEVNLTATVTETHSGTHTDTYKLTTSPFGTERDIPLPGAGLALSGRRSVPVPMALPALAPGTAQGQMVWSFSPGGTDADPVAKLFLTDHSQLPEDGKAFAARVTWQNAKPQMVKVSLSGVSSEKGICLNEGPTPEPPSPENLDLKPSAPGNFVAMPEGTDGWTGLAIRPSGSSLDVRILCRDYGAYGKLTAEILVNGRWYRAKPQGTTLSEIPVPWDEDGNHVADAWEQGNRHDADWDEETDPPGNGTLGDGFRYYEEYRGVMAQGKHKRLDPKKWDLVVENRIGAQAKTGLALFANRSGINVVELQRGELPASRVVTANRDQGNGKPNQYGVLLVNDTVADGPGEARPADVSPKTPKLTDMVAIDITGIANNVAGNPGLTVAYQQAVTIAHELAHACRVSHHGDSHLHRHTNVNLTRHNPGFDERGNAWPLPAGGTYRLPEPIGVFGGESSGAVECIMTYNDDCAWVYHRPTSSYYKVPAVGEIQPLTGLAFCQSKTGTGINAPNNQPVPFFGDATNGACKTQLRVRDDP